MTTYDLIQQKRLEYLQPAQEAQVSSKKDDDVLLSEELLEEYDNAPRKEWARNALLDDSFRNGVMWDPPAIKVLQARNQMPVVINLVHPYVEQAKALLTTNKPKFQAAAREDSDVKIAKVITDLMSYIWDNSDGNVHFKRAIDDYYVRGMGVLYSYYDPQADFGNGEILLGAADPMDVFVDPNCRDLFGRDAQHIIIARVLTREQIQHYLPEIVPKLTKARRVASSRHPVLERAGLEGQVIDRTQLDGASDTEYYEVIDRHSRVKKTTYKVTDKQTGQETIIENDKLLTEYMMGPAFIRFAAGKLDIVINQQEVEELSGVMAQTGGIYHYAIDPTTNEPTIIPGPAIEDPAAVEGSEVQLQPITRMDAAIQGVLDVTPILVDRIQRVLSIGGVLAYKGLLPVSNHPIVLLQNRHNRNPYPISDVRLVRPIVEYVNKVRSLIMAHTANSANLKVFVPKGAVVKSDMEQEWAKAGAGFIEYNPEFGVPVIAAPPPLPNELYKMEADCRRDIQEILGIYPMMQGDAGDAPATYKGTLAIEEYGQRRIRSKKDDLEEALNILARVTVEMMQQVYTKPKIIRIVEPNHPERQTSLNMPMYSSAKEVIGMANDITTGKYDIVIVSGSTLPVNRWARFDYYVSLYEKGIIDQVEVLKQTDVADMQGVMERFSQMQALTQQLTQAQEEIKRLSGDLQTAQRESIADRKRVIVKDFEAQIKGETANVRAAAQIHKSRLGDIERNAKKQASGGPKKSQ